MSAAVDRGRFRLEALLADASAATGGLTDLGQGPGFDDCRPALAALIESTLDEAQLRDAEAFRAFLLHHLQNRLRIAASWRRFPAIAALPLPPALFLSGLPRAGTTTFSRLLAEDPAARSLRLWELHSPAPTDLAHPAALTEDRLAAAEQLVLARARRGTLELRPMSLFSADECFYLLRNSFASDQLHRAVARRPSYARWVAAQERSSLYGYYASQLRLLLWQRPCPPGGHLVLKCPLVHSESPLALFAHFPGAVVVDLHRDVAAVLASLCHKNLSDRQAHSDHVSARDVGADMVENLERHYRRRAAEVAQLPAAQRRRILRCDYARWSRDAGSTLAAVARVHAFLGDQLGDPPGSHFSAALAARLTAALPRHAAYGAGDRYDLAEFGLRADELRERFAPYDAAFRAQVTSLDEPAAGAP